jgi:hypothetical protein
MQSAALEGALRASLEAVDFASGLQVGDFEVLSVTRSGFDLRVVVSVTVESSGERGANRRKLHQGQEGSSQGLVSGAVEDIRDALSIELAVMQDEDLLGAGSGDVRRAALAC